eukprot:8357508-Alexandrium_andersonii.AAC.1
MHKRVLQLAPSKASPTYRQLARLVRLESGLQAVEPGIRLVPAAGAIGPQPPDAGVRASGSI